MSERKRRPWDNSEQSKAPTPSAPPRSLNNPRQAKTNRPAAGQPLLPFFCCRRRKSRIGRFARRHHHLSQRWSRLVQRIQNNIHPCVQGKDSNRLAILVWYFEKNGLSHVSYFDANVNGLKIVSDASGRAHKNEADIAAPEGDNDSKFRLPDTILNKTRPCASVMILWAQG